MLFPFSIPPSNMSATIYKYKYRDPVDVSVSASACVGIGTRVDTVVDRER